MQRKYQFKHVALSFLCGSIFFSGVSFAATQNIQASLDRLKFIVDGKDQTPKDGKYDNNGTKVPASIIYDGTTYVPLRMISSLLGKSVDWDASCKAVIIGSKASEDVMKQACTNPDAARLASANFLFFDRDELIGIKKRYQDGDQSIAASVDLLKEAADKEMQSGPYSVTYKTSTPPSGDKHDYVSIGIYWWPDPSKPDGKPYIRKDGFVNPESRNATFDKDSLVKVNSAIRTLTLASFYTGNEAYAEYAAKLLRTWYMDPATKMNPNLNYGQSVPGVNDGRKEGIIETINIMNTLDYVSLLGTTKYLPESDMKQFKGWIGEYSQWLLTNEIGISEGKSKNNHGTWYDAQVASFALFSGQKDFAKKIIEGAKARIDAQIEPDGKMPLEMERTRSLHYPLYNLQGFVYLAQLGDQVGVDLWSYESADGRSIRKSLDFLAPYYSGEKVWELEQAVQENMSEAIPVFIPAAEKYKDEAYKKTALKLLQEKQSGRENLLYDIAK